MATDDPLSYVEWAFLSWVAENPKSHCFYITANKVISQFEFTAEADKAAQSLVKRGFFDATSYRCYRINDAGLGALRDAAKPEWQTPNTPAFSVNEHVALNSLYERGADSEWKMLTSVDGLSRAKLVSALQALVAHGLATATQKPGAEIYTQENVRCPSLFRHSRFGWHYMLTTHGVEKLCELDLE